MQFLFVSSLIYSLILTQYENFFKKYKTHNDLETNGFLFSKIQ